MPGLRFLQSHAAGGRPDDMDNMDNMIRLAKEEGCLE